MAEFGQVLSDTLACVKAVATGSIETIARHETGDLIVDTCLAPDTGKYETGISHADYHDGKFIIVAQYPDQGAATKGHEEWVATMTADELPDELRDIDLWQLGIEPYPRCKRKELGDD